MRSISTGTPDPHPATELLGNLAARTLYGTASNPCIALLCSRRRITKVQSVSYDECITIRPRSRSRRGKRQLQEAIMGVATNLGLERRHDLVIYTIPGTHHSNERAGQAFLVVNRSLDLGTKESVKMGRRLRGKPY